MVKPELQDRLARKAAEAGKAADAVALELGRGVLAGAYQLIEVEASPHVELVCEDKEVSSLFEAARAIAHENGEKLRALRCALEAGTKEAALLLARELVGLKGVDDEAGNRAASRIH